MRYAMWTPLPPERSGIADYSYDQLAALAGLVEVQAVNRDPMARAPAGVEVTGPDSATGLPIYQMGNDLRYHGWIYDQLLAEPGLVVLHDPSLMDFAWGRFGGFASTEFRDEVRFAHGPIWGPADDESLVAGWPAVEVDGVPMVDPATLTMERRIVSSSSAVVVHDPYAAGWLGARYPATPIHLVPHGVNVQDDSRRPAARARLGWADRDTVFGVFGGVSHTKRVLVTVLAFGQISRRWPRARLLIAGHQDSAASTAQIHALIDSLGLADSVRVVLGAPIDQFGELIAATDAVVNLRWPTAGETSGVTMRALGAGRLVIASDLPQYRHFDPAFCWRVPVEPAAEAETLLKLFTRVAEDRDEARAAGQRARDTAAQQWSWGVVAEQLRSILATATSGAAPAAPVDKDLPGVNVFADSRATTGLAEAARRHAMALLDAGVDITFNDFNSRAHNRSVRPPRRLVEQRRGKDHPTDLWLLNVNEFDLVPEHAIDRYAIALWAWEFLDVPHYAQAELARIDELWVVSSFIAESFRTATDMPITVIPNVVAIDPNTPADRSRFGLRPDALVVLFSFSASSSSARKNPMGAVEAVRRAFPPGERGRAQLVIKAVDLHLFPAVGAELAEAVAGVGGVLIDADLSRTAMDTLLASCDVYLSLHRAEGFGLGMAEAMALGKPVIATGYSGNIDFMPPGAAATVGYRIRPITEHDHRLSPVFVDHYRPGQLWAEPDVDQAARWLRRLADSETLRRRLGARGAEVIDSMCSPKAVGERMVRRLKEIAGLRVDAREGTP